VTPARATKCKPLAFPCPTGATTSTPVANDYEWEDSSNSAWDARDFFFSLTTTCTLDQWSNALNIAALVNEIFRSRARVDAASRFGYKRRARATRIKNSCPRPRCRPIST
jgi:hypothetical protein